jgi:hypothetical protein
MTAHFDLSLASMPRAGAGQASAESTQDESSWVMAS